MNISPLNYRACYGPWLEYLHMTFFFKITHGMIETSVVPVIYAEQRATRSSSSNTKYVIPRCKTTTYQKSFIIRACRLWNAPVNVLNFDTDNISYFKRILLSYYHNSLTLNYDSENPRTFKSTCLKCNLVRSLEKPISCSY